MACLPHAPAHACPRSADGTPVSQAVLRDSDRRRGDGGEAGWGPLSPTCHCLAEWMQAFPHPALWAMIAPSRHGCCEMNGADETGLCQAALGLLLVWLSASPPSAHPCRAAVVSHSKLPAGRTEASGLLCPAERSSHVEGLFHNDVETVPKLSGWKEPELTNPNVSLCVKKQGSNRFMICPVHLCFLPMAGMGLGSWMVLCTGLPEGGRWMGGWVILLSFIVINCNGRCYSGLQFGKRLPRRKSRSDV